MRWRLGDEALEYNQSLMGKINLIQNQKPLNVPYDINVIFENVSNN